MISPITMTTRAVRGLWQGVRRDEFFRRNATYFCLTMMAAVLSYLFHPVLARLLSLRDYGEVTAIQSLFVNLSVGFGVFGSIATNIIANSDDHDHAERLARTRLLGQLRSLLALAVLVVLVLIVLASGWIGRFLHLTSTSAVAVLSLSYLLGVGILFRRSYLRGTRSFGQLGLSQIIESGVRVAAAGLLAWLGFRVLGVISGLLFSQVVILAHLLLVTRGRFDAGRIGRPTLSPEVRRELRYGLLILAVAVTQAFLGSADMLVVKHYFPADQAGAYGGITTVAHIVLYVAGSVVSVLASSVRLRQSARANQHLLAKSLLWAGLLAGGSLAVFLVAPRFFVRLFVGPSFLAGASWLGPMGFLMFLLALINPVFSYYLALRQRFIAWLGLGGTAIILGLCAVNHATPLAVIVDFVIGVMLMMAGFAVRWLAAILKYRLYARS